MKKLLFLAAGALVLSANLSSCKKGENDPFLSLKSRKARVAGEWTVTKYERISSSVDAADPEENYSSTASYDGTTATGTYTSSLGTTPSTPYTYTESYTFEKDGTFTKTRVEGTETEVISGNWIFLGKNKNADLAKKEAIMLSYNSYVVTEGGASDTETSNGYSDTETFLIDQLKSKEMILIQESTSTYDMETYSSKKTWTLTAK
jgi:hypothetical protein